MRWSGCSKKKKLPGQFSISLFPLLSSSNNILDFALWGAINYPVVSTCRLALRHGTPPKLIIITVSSGSSAVDAVSTLSCPPLLFLRPPSSLFSTSSCLCSRLSHDIDPRRTLAARELLRFAAIRLAPHSSQLLLDGDTLFPADPIPFPIKR